MQAAYKVNSSDSRSAGSALIMAVVLSSLLAIVGVLFVIITRVNEMTTSSISENMDLDFAVDTVIAKLSQQLVRDVPAVVEPNQEYYDYPDANNLWLASLEPYQSGGNYYWRQISDITGLLAGYRNNIQIKPVSDYAPAVDFNDLNTSADADGDGVGDSKWVKLGDIISGKGKPIYEAVRMIDNCAMLNVNTAYRFDPADPNSALSDIDGTSQMQINLMALAGRPGYPPSAADRANLLLARANNGLAVNPWDLGRYQLNVVWNFGEPFEPYYTPFDISDELELRYRFLLNHTDIDTRLEAWTSQLRTGTLSTPVTSNGALPDWFKRASGNGGADPNYAYRHIASIYSMDRIINPSGHALNNGKMVNVNIADANLLYSALKAGLSKSVPNATLVNKLAAQLAVNIVDHRDYDTDITSLPVGGKIYHGFEAQPFLSEITFRIAASGASTSSNNYFAVELYNPFTVAIPLGDFILDIRDANSLSVKKVTLAGSVMAPKSYFVVTSGDAASIRFGVAALISTGKGKQDPNLVLADFTLVSANPETYALKKKYDVYLLRKIAAEQLYMDKQKTDETWFNWSDIKDAVKSYARADGNWNILYQVMSSAANTLGLANGINGPRKNYNLENSTGLFYTIGDISRVLTVSPSTDPNDMLGQRLAASPPESFIRLDLRNPAFANIFQYLTVFDPAIYGWPATETRIKGRININTAPAFVIAQLPWMLPSIAQAIVAYRDKAGAFTGIGSLMQVPEMGYYAYDPLFAKTDLVGPPDLTPSDGAIGDFEAQDLIFSRISNLITVRSDIFTAYILVRIGTDGPRKRVIAILDRSQVNSPSDKVRILALHPVPDPR
jgi:hypothetical protein